MQLTLKLDNAWAVCLAQHGGAPLHVLHLVAVGAADCVLRLYILHTRCTNAVTTQQDCALTLCEEAWAAGSSGRCLGPGCKACKHIECGNGCLQTTSEMRSGNQVAFSISCPWKVAGHCGAMPADQALSRCSSRCCTAGQLRCINTKAP